MSIAEIITFQSTLPRRERHGNSPDRDHNNDHFNPRSREGSDGVKVPVNAEEIDFNPRSREGSDIIWLITYYIANYFNPRSREGSDAIDILADPGTLISIHAPAKGATLTAQEFDSVMAISIHAPAKGATQSRPD